MCPPTSHRHHPDSPLCAHHPPLPRGDTLPDQAQTAIYQCQLTTCQSPTSTHTDPSQANGSCFRLCPLGGRYTLTQGHPQPCGIHACATKFPHSTHASTHRHTHVTSTLTIPLQPHTSTTHFPSRSYPRSAFHIPALIDKLTPVHTYKTHSASRPHTQSGPMCTLTLIQSPESDPHVDVTDTSTHPKTCVCTYACAHSLPHLHSPPHSSA